MTVSEAVLDGRYRLIAPIAAGGMSVVWRGHDEVLARPVAVKVLASAGSKVGGDPMFAERVRREAMAIARISHPYIANVYDYGESTGAGGITVPYIVMELVEGESLAQVLARGRLSWPTAAGICAQVAAALAAAHQLGVVHRDVTPANVMLCVDGVKVVDFGISATTGQSADESGQVFGTPAYLAPERLSGGPAQAATDVYGVGLLLYEAITGHLPWSAATTTQMLTAHQYEPPAPLPSVPGMPTQVADPVCSDARGRPEPTTVQCADLQRAGHARAGRRSEGQTVASGRDDSGRRYTDEHRHASDAARHDDLRRSRLRHGGNGARQPHRPRRGIGAVRPTPVRWLTRSAGLAGTGAVPQALAEATRAQGSRHVRVAGRAPAVPRQLPRLGGDASSRHTAAANGHADRDAGRRPESSVCAPKKRRVDAACDKCMHRQLRVHVTLDHRLHRAGHVRQPWHGGARRLGPDVQDAGRHAGGRRLERAVATGR